MQPTFGKFPLAMVLALTAVLGFMTAAASAADIYFIDSFDDNSAGWTTGADWEISTAQAGGGSGGQYMDPALDHTGNVANGVAGVVIGGNPPAQVQPVSFLTSPVIDLSSAVGDTITLTYYRWLNSDHRPYEEDGVQVWDGSQWVILWANGHNLMTTDNAWVKCTFEISDYAIGDFQVRFGYRIGQAGGVATGSWNIDDILIVNCPSPLFVEEFRDNSAGWTLGNEWEIDTAVGGFGDPATDHTPNSNNSIAGVNIGGPFATPTLHGYYYLTSPVIDTSGVTGTLWLNFYRDLYSDYTPYMNNVIEVFDGATWTQIWQSGSSPGVDDSNWTFISHDITAYANAIMQFRFGFNIGSTGVYTNRGGWNVDDVVVWQEPPPNNAPVLTDIAVTANDVLEDTAAPAGVVGTLVSDIISGGPGGNFSDADGDPAGLALTGVSQQIATVWYSLNGGTTWSPVGNVLPHSALLLEATPNTRLFFEPLADEYGTIMNAATFVAWDGNYGTAGMIADARNQAWNAFSNTNDTIAVTVLPVNDAPTFTAGSGTTVDEDAGPMTLSGWASGMDAGVNEGSQVLTFMITNNTNAALFSAGPAVDAVTGDLTFETSADAFGTADITIALMDDGGTANGGTDTSAPVTITITVNPVNDAPSFTAPTLITVNEDDGPIALNAWATAISAGPNEVGQTVTASITNNTDPSLFSTAPTFDPVTGDFDFEAGPNMYGSADITLVLSDDGGTANGGVDTAAPFTVTIEVMSVNDPMSIGLATGSVLLGDVANGFTAELTQGNLVTGWSLTAEDPIDGSDITVQNVTTTTPILGVSAPTVGTSGMGTLTISWTGTVDASVEPGVYTYTVTLSDGDPTTFDVVITVLKKKSDSGCCGALPGSTSQPMTLLLLLTLLVPVVVFRRRLIG